MNLSNINMNVLTIKKTSNINYTKNLMKHPVSIRPLCHRLWLIAQLEVVRSQTHVVRDGLLSSKHRVYFITVINRVALKIIQSFIILFLYKKIQI